MTPKPVNILWQPHPKQAEFLSAAEDEVVYGGAAGGGKSDALMIDALGLNQKNPAILNPRYRALIIRRSTPELREIIDRSRVIYPAVVAGAVFHEQAKEWRFPSGAKVIFGYCERDADVYRYQGQEYQWIGIDELGQFPTPFIWQYLGTRLRSSDPTLKCYMRATCNPGAKWIPDYFGFSLAGEASLIEIGGIKRRFIPSRLRDNPSLPASYEMRLQTLPENERAALLEGRWDVVDVPGAIYRSEMMAALAEGRISSVPIEPSLLVHTYWDLGMGDSTAIWFVQYYGRERRYIDYFEASGEGLPFYRVVLDQKGYNYGTHFAPHDIQVRELGSGKSRLEVAGNLGIKFEVTPNIGLEDGIHEARMVLANCWFDATRCADGVDALRNYRRDYSQKLGEFKTSPVHDWASHCADAFRYSAVAPEPARTGGGKALNFASEWA